MGRKTLLGITLIIIAIIAGYVLLFWHKRAITADVLYGNNALWNRFLEEEGSVDVPKSTRAVILPHHLITATELTKFYRGMANKFQPKTVILVGPNHYEEGVSNIQTCNCTYSTIKGELNTNETIFKSAVKNGFVVNNKPFKKEHSMYAHAPFIKNFFPKADIVPFILKWKTPDKEVDQLANFISSLAGKKDVLVIASVDFSHYIPLLAADFHDQSSFTAIKNFDQKGIKFIEVDSPASLRLVTRFAEQQSLMNVSLLNHTNSQDFFRQKKLEITTSHEFISFSEGEPKKAKQVSMHFFGDAMFGRGVAELMTSEDILATLAGQEGRFFIGNDYNILNLEGVLGSRSNAQKKAVTFQFDPRQTISLLKKYGFNAVNLANNHILDYFADGDKETRSNLAKANIVSFGGYETGDKACTTTSKNGLKIALCGFNDVGEVLNVESFIKKINNAKKEHDFVFINAHWGEEYSTVPTLRQKDLAHKFIDTGADLIIGHHPHVVQPMEIYKEKPIFYSLGNFIFDQKSPENVKTGFSVGVVASKEKMILYIIPLHTNAGKPIWMNHKETTAFLNKYLKGFEQYKSDILGKLEVDK